MADTSPLLQANAQLVVSALLAQTDAAAAKLALQKLALASELDLLTELPNRQSLITRFKYAQSHARRGDTQLAILFVDLNNFKQINDTLGHAVGDQVLRLVAKRLATAVRESDTVSRHGGDEFVILLTDVSNATDVVQIADKLIAALGRAARVGNHLLEITASIGISLFPNDGEDIDTLIESADAAMYRAKRGQVGIAFHSQAAKGHPWRPSCRQTGLRNANSQLVLAALVAQQLQEQAEQAQRRQTEFLAFLAHELRNPLMPIRQAVRLLERTRTDAKQLPRIQAIIEKQVVHMSRLINDLLDVARISTGKLTVERETLDLADILRAAVAASLSRIDARLQRFTVEIAVDSAPFLGDPVRLTQIVTNLLDNASKYSQESADIFLSLGQTTDGFVIRVTDTGIGMSKETLDTVFEPFFQAKAAVEFNHKGLGIGLAVVRELVLAHGGAISASSDGPGTGSVFVVTLPSL
jgi:diguanylate cyclase